MVEGDGYAVANVEALGDGPGFRKVRRELGVTAFGVNAIELPPGYETGRHFHDEQEELYFVHRGRIEITFGDDADARARPGRPRARGRRDRPQDQERGRRARALPRRRRQGRLRGPRRPAARGRDQPRSASRARRRPHGRPRELVLHGASRIGAAVLARLPRLPARQPLEPARGQAARAPDSDAIVRSIGAGDNMHADFGSGLYEGGPIGIPYMTVGAGQPRVPVSFDYADESDRGRYPIPPRAPIEGGRGADGDRHVIVVDRSRCRLYELFDAHPLERRRALARRLGRDLQPALEPPAAARLDVGRRRRAADPARAWRATPRSAAAASITRCASRRRARGARSSTRRAISRPT